MSRTTVTRFEEDPAPLMDLFSVEVPVGTFPGLSVSFADIVAGA